MEYYAHSLTEDKNKWQPLKDHLSSVSLLAGGFANKFGAQSYGETGGRFHDLGKYQIVFQRRLEGSKERIPHSSAGAKELLALYSGNTIERIIATMIAYCIVGHHTGLPNYSSVTGDQTAKTLKSRLKEQITDYSAYKDEILLEEIDFPSKLPIIPDSSNFGSTFSFFIRMLYSTIVDADFLDTEIAMNDGVIVREPFPSLSVLEQKLNFHLESFMNPQNEINHQRTKTLRECIEKGKNTDRGYYSLTVPTGGGKTLASLAFAMKHAIRNEMDRIIYVIPYTSIIDQTASNFKNIFGDSNVLEHQSNFDWNKFEKQLSNEEIPDYANSMVKKLRLASENWDVPIVVTTNVQFFESLYSNRSSKTRKLHNIVNSIIIFDEAQMIPIDFMLPCIKSVHELVKNYRATAVFCTATQPKLAQFFPDSVSITEIIDDTYSLEDFYKRVDVNYIGIKNRDQIAKLIASEPQVLCIVNTKQKAIDIFNLLPEDGRFHLSTYMCPVHRHETLAEIKNRLQNGQTCRVVSTSLIEAGVDIDFPIGFRELTGLDSLIQSAGRINRENRLTTKGKLFIFELADETKTRVPSELKQRIQISKQLINKYHDNPISIKAIEEYFTQLYSVKTPASFDIAGIMQKLNSMSPELVDIPFKTIADDFKLIEDRSIPIIIPYNNEAVKFISQLEYSDFPRKIVRELQKFTVNVYQYEYERLLGAAIINTIFARYNVLINPAENYGTTGIKIPPADQSLGIMV